MKTIQLWVTAIVSSAFSAACGEAPATPETTNDELKRAKGETIWIDCACNAGPCSDKRLDYVRVFYDTARPARLHLRNFFDYVSDPEGTYPKGQTDLEAPRQTNAGTVAEFGPLTSFDALTKKPVAARPDGAYYVGGSAAIEAPLLEARSFDGPAPPDAVRYVYGSLTIKAADFDVGYACTVDRGSTVSVGRSRRIS